MSVIHNDLLLSTDAATGYNLTKSLRLRNSASAYLNRTPSNGNRKTFTISMWFKRGMLASGSKSYNIISAWSSGTGSNIDTIDLYGDNIRFFLQGSSNGYLKTTQVLRDPSAWYHIVAVCDTTQATSSNRLKLYLNGNQITSFDTPTYPTLNSDSYFNSSSFVNYIGQNGFSSGDSYDGYLTEVNFIDGQALTPSSFGENNATTGVWQPKRYTGTYGTNGFYLPFTDVATTSGSNAGLGKDFSGNGNYWNTNNISVTAGSTYDSMTDVPTLTSATAANYATLNPLNKNGSLVSLTNGNLTAYTATNDICYTPSTVALVAGNKYYFELTCQTNTGSNFYQGIGIWSTAQFTPYDSSGYATYFVYNAQGGFYNGTSGYNGSYGATWTNGDVIGVAVDMVAGSMTFYKNGTSQGVASTIIDLSYSYYVNLYTYTTQASLNFGQRPFAYTPPTGFVALNTYNLPDSTIVAGNTVMDATTYTANGGSQTVTNAGGFKPDLVWTKIRSGADNHLLGDSVRGVANLLRSNTTGAETNSPTYYSSFDSTGFTLGSGNLANGSTVVGWQWQAGQGTTSSNTNGSITSTVSVNASAGFSVVTFTAQSSGSGTVGHGLGVAPKFIITKSRAQTYGWAVYHTSIGNTGYVTLNTTNAVTTNAIWNNTSPTSSVFSLGSDFAGNDSCVAYCWAEIAGFSKFGSYTGNGSTDGAFVYTGFRPKFVMIKCTQTADYGHWAIKDTSRSPSNVATQQVYANFAYGEDNEVTEYTDILSNGFKLRGNLDGVNGSGKTYIYMAFAENPFKNSLAR